ncbi:MAG TPA: hypothetical protein VGM54_04345 [Chthoniobacter sp.]|jgi:hypothetical protein
MKACKLIAAIGAASLLSFVPLFAVTSPSHETMTYSGDITTVCPTAHTITVLHNGSTETFRVGNHSQLSTLRKSDANLKDFEFGDKVFVRYQDKAAGVTATNVREEPMR